MYIIQTEKWTQGYQDFIRKNYECKTLKQGFAIVNNARMNNDMIKYTPISVYNVIDTEE